jgi:DNA polymerase-3 subunit epsilon
MGLTAAGAVSLGDTESLLADRAATFLAGGPADASALISYVCQLPGAPPHVAEHMAAALFAGQRRFARLTDGRWQLRDAPTGTMTGSAAPATVREVVSYADTRSFNPTLESTHALGATFAVVDVETTGMRATGGDRVTEVAVVLVRGGVATPVFDTLINPERAIPPAIVAITNITWEMVKDAPRFADVCDQLVGVLEGHVFVAHNAGFDWRFLSMEVERATRRPLIGRRLCTVRMARRLVPQLQRRNLDAVTHYFGIEIGARHRAGGDALATAHVLLRLLDAARDRGCTSIDDVERLVDTRRVVTRPRRPPAMPRPMRDDPTA